ncbi:unnamed protein product [Choristocarpus tenellus]
MAITNVNGNLMDCNEQLSRTTGYTREDMRFLTIFNLVTDAFLQQTFSMISGMLTAKEALQPNFFEVQGKRRDGRPAGVMCITAVQDSVFRPRFFVLSVPSAASSSSSINQQGQSGGGAGIGLGLGVGATVGGAAVGGTTSF